MTRQTADQATAPILGDHSTDHRDDRAAIEHIVRDIETGFNAGDADLLAEHFAENGFAVSVTGALVAGREEMRETGRRLLSGPLRGQRARYELADVQFLRPDVAVARKHAWAVDADGADLDVGHTMVALYVLVKEDGRWWVAARQNTLRSEPG